MSNATKTNTTTCDFCGRKATTECPCDEGFNWSLCDKCFMNDAWCDEEEDE
jgi:hypothetical protein